MTYDARAKQALYMAKGGRSKAATRGAGWWLRIIIPVAIAAAVLAGFML